MGPNSIAKEFTGVRKISHEFRKILQDFAGFRKTLKNNKIQPSPDKEYHRRDQELHKWWSMKQSRPYCQDQHLFKAFLWKNNKMPSKKYNFSYLTYVREGQFHFINS